MLITKNEERQIARCLESARWADEIIVVDGESTDRTVEICRQYGAQVISHAFCGDFGHERNLGNEAATGDWILQLDADDTVSPQLRESIERILRVGSPHHAFKFRRRNWFLGHDMRHGGWYHYYPHFFRRGQAVFKGRVHHLLKSAEPPVILDGDLEHRPFDSLERFIGRHNRYTAIEAEEMFQQDGASQQPQIRYHVARRPLRLFWKTYVKKQGFREGWHGLVFSMLFAWVHFLKWAKYSEQCGGAGRIITDEVERQNHETAAKARELMERHGPASPAALWVELCARPAVALWRASRSRQDERELIAGLLAMFAQVMVWAKYWDLSVSTSTPHLEVMHAAREA